MTDRQRLLELLATRSARRGQFTLASGRRSSLYIDARLTTMSPDGLAIIGPLALSTLHEHGWQVDAVGGLTLGADPVAYAIAYASADSDRPIRAFTVRKESKPHGTKKLIEGPLQPGDVVAIVEDVITTGGSALREAEVVRAAGGSIIGIIALVDREEGGRQTLEQAGLPVISLTTAAEIATRMQA